MTESVSRLSVMVLHGPNLNLLGTREPDVYGMLTLEEVDRRIADRAASKGIRVRSFQSNIEGELVDAIQDAIRWADGLVINAGGYSHTSVAIRDAIAAVHIPAVAVHLSNPAAREEFRHSDLVAGACWGVISGFGWVSYVLALDALADRPARGPR
jgi:3-dehydroquinate dehydratase II